MFKPAFLRRLTCQARLSDSRRPARTLQRNNAGVNNNAGVSRLSVLSTVRREPGRLDFSELVKQNVSCSQCLLADVRLRTDWV